MRLRDLFRSQPTHERKSTSSLIFDSTAFVHSATDRDTDALQKYLLAGFPADQVDPISRSTALHTAVEASNLRALQLLLQFGAQVNVLDQNQSSPLHIAASMASEEIVHLLLTHGADLYQLDNTGRTAFHLAVTTANLRLVQHLLSIDPKLLDLSDAQNWTPLMCACASDQLPMCSLLLSHGARLDLRNDRGMNVFHLLAFLGSFGLLEEVLHQTPTDDDGDLWKKLLNQVDEHHQTPLFYACLEGHWPLAQLLLTFGADPFHLDHEQQTCLHAMFSSSVILRRHIRLFSQLIDRFDYRTFEDHHGRTLLDLTDLYQLKSLSAFLVTLHYRRNCQILTEHDEPSRTVLSLRHLCLLQFKSVIPINRSSSRELLEKALRQCFQLLPDTSMRKAFDDCSLMGKKSLAKSTKKSRKTASVGTTLQWDYESVQPSPSTWSVWTNKFKTTRISTPPPSETSLLLRDHPLKTLVLDLLHHPTRLAELVDFPFCTGNVSLEEDLRRVMANYNLQRTD